jgi:acetyl esterase/lipase
MATVVVVDVNQTLDPEIEPGVAQLGSVAIDESLLPVLRAPRPGPPLSDAVVRTDRIVPADPDVVVRVHRPVGAEDALSCVVSFHGGGLVIGSRDSDDALFDDWCPTLGVVGVSVEYRLAPETPYPGALDDGYAALRWCHEHADELGVDPLRIGVRGISAGGGIAAALALLARDRDEALLAFQLLDCPMLDDRQITPSSRSNGLAVWSRESNAFGWRSYLGDRHGTEDVPFTAAPARATDLSDLPPAFVSVGSVDGFRDEDVDYALRLNQAGVPCELHVYPGAPHGYQYAADSHVARQSKRDAAAWLARQIERP